jgi:cobalt/nickel transport system ATP-binding protein
MSEALLRIESVSFRYGGRPALEDVSLSVAQGERVGLIGPNAAGKSTLLLCIMGVLHPSGGRIGLEGYCSERREDVAEMRRRIGMVFQSTEDQLFNATVMDDVAFGPLNMGLEREEALQRSHEALHRVGVDHALFETPPFRLSAGQRRRVALAGVLAMRPGLLLLDEPASDLDPRGRRELVELIGGLGTAALVASHDLDFVLRCCPRSVVLDGGRVVADGPSGELMGDAALMEAHALEVPPALQR